MVAVTVVCCVIFSCVSTAFCCSCWSRSLFEADPAGEAGGRARLGWCDHASCPGDKDEIKRLMEKHVVVLILVWEDFALPAGDAAQV